MTGSIRDRQRQKVYNAERVAFVGPPDAPNLPPDYKTVPQCQAYVDRIVGSEAWRALGFSHLGLFGWSPVTVKDGRMRRRGGADSFDNTISMPRWTRVNYYILHELAHIANDYLYNFEVEENGDISEIYEESAPHGPQYAGVYAYLVRGLLGGEAYGSLLQSFEEYRVKRVPPALAKTAEEDVEVDALVSLGAIPDPDPLTDTDTLGGHCLNCGIVLMGTRQKFCSDACRYAYHNHLRHERGEDERQKVCQVCSKEFTAARSDAKTCSPRCRQRLKRSGT